MVRKLLKNVAILSCLVFGTQVQAQYDFNGGLQNWTSGYGTEDITHDASEGVTGDGALKLIRKSNNSNIGFNQGIDADTYKYIKIRLKNLTPANTLRIQGSQDAGNTIKLTNQAVSITPSLDEYVTVYVDMTGQTNWSGSSFANLDILVRANFVDVASDNAIYFDEIEFLASLPADEFSEFVKNPNFEDTTGTTFLSGGKTFVTRTITGAEAHDGVQSLKLEFTGDADSTFWTFSSYEKTYGTVYPVGSELEVKMWVKTNRSSTIDISGRVKLTNGGSDTATKPITTVETTNTAMGWEQITLTMVAAEAFDGVTFWFAIPFASGESTNLLNGDIVYLDNFTASITDATLSVESKKIEGAVVDTENGNITVTGADLDAVYSITGQQVGATGLASGVYIVKISKGNLQEAVKVSM